MHNKPLEAEVLQVQITDKNKNFTKIQSSLTITSVLYHFLSLKSIGFKNIISSSYNFLINIQNVIVFSAINYILFIPCKAFHFFMFYVLNDIFSISRYDSLIKSNALFLLFIQCFFCCFMFFLTTAFFRWASAGCGRGQKRIPIRGGAYAPPLKVLLF